MLPPIIKDDRPQTVANLPKNREVVNQDQKRRRLDRSVQLQNINHNHESSQFNNQLRNNQDNIDINQFITIKTENNIKENNASKN